MGLLSNFGRFYKYIRIVLKLTEAIQKRLLSPETN